MTDSLDKPALVSDGSQDILNPLLLISVSARSGTTLLMQLLGTSQEIVFDRIYPYEIRYLTYLLQWALLLKDQRPPTREWNLGSNFVKPGDFTGPFPSVDAQFWDGDAMWKQSFVSAWKSFSHTAIGKSSNGVSPKYYAEKAAPWSPSYLTQILPYHAILLVRDPRDTFLSITAFDKKRGFPGFSRRKWETNWMFARRYVRLIRERVNIIKYEQSTSKSLLIKYEDLVADLESQAQLLEHWLNVELNPTQVENEITNFAHHMTSDSPRQSINRWKREMPPKLNAYFIKELHEELTYFGYEV